MENKRIFPEKREIEEEELSGFDPILLEKSMEISVPLSAENIRSFSSYATVLREWNQKMNLTNITDDEGVAMRHFIDSLTLTEDIEREKREKNAVDLSLLDVGTGAGLPGIPLKITMPSLQITLLDSLRKRVLFLEEVCRVLELRDIHVVHARAEDAGNSRVYREQFDVVTARAVAALPVLSEYCIPFVKIGGVFLAMKGQNEDEAASSRKAIVQLGGTIEAIRNFTLPGTDMRRSIITIRKIRHTPPRYPRKAGSVRKDPLK